MDGSAIVPFCIFKGQNVLRDWIPPEIHDQWFFSANSKGWTSNLHGLEWLKRVFEPITRSKAEGQHRLLVCDGHDSHISGSFVAHCLQNRIVLLILPPHTSHILQTSDVAIFGPLKKRLTANLSYLNQTQLARIQKFEWFEAYIKARKEVFDQSHIKSAWRGASLIPFNRMRVLRSIDDVTGCASSDFSPYESPTDTLGIMSDRRSDGYESSMNSFGTVNGLSTNGYESHWGKATCIYVLQPR